ncbi:hypothetical protein KSP35_22140 [Aquihabitans sp. G128]|uniref:esterase/lipase family protein n=1 Tax=Aquihabitans sp. G128 TaxID=2849779 RepID=UPI001C233C05|nr:hypothetical protein [Aquihabitans sp. G128]QXC60980.1 hypothetical protein KSP35_22140 [Aquihabitans sp. G128]
MTPSRRPRRGLHALALVAVGLLATLGATACEPARTPAKDRVVIMVHGYSAFGNGVNCNSSFGTLSSALRSRGFTGDLVTVGFYDSDTNCSVNLRSWDSGISNSSAWKTIAKAFSKYVYETYTKKGITVDVVGHSMGGLIARGAVYGSESGQSGFSPKLLVEDAVTLGTPHKGAAWYSTGCLYGQCYQLKPGAEDIVWLNQNGNPQGAKGTDWTVLASTADDVTPADSGLYMVVPAARKVTYGNLEHSDYQQDATSIARIAQALSDPGL